MSTVTLTSDEMLQAVIVGGHRRITSLLGRRLPQHYVSDDNSEWSTEIEACCAEIAFARHIDRYWQAGVFDGATARADVAGCQVRHTHHPGGHLIVYVEDLDDDPVVLVIGRAPTFTIVGWARAGDAKQAEYWRPDVLHPSFWIPQSVLRRLEER